MRMEDLNLSILMGQHSMSENLPFQSYPADLLVSRQTDPSVLSTRVKKEESSLFWVQSNSSPTNSSKTKTTKRSRKRFSNGFWIRTKMLSSSVMLMMKPRSMSISTYLILLRLQIDLDLVSKRVMKCQKISQRSSITRSLNSTLTSYQNRLNYSKHLA